MPATKAQIASLADPTPAEEIGSKPGKGGSGTLSYVDARFVFDRFDQAVGPENWQVQIAWSGVLHTPAMLRSNGEVIIPEWESSYPVASIGVLTEQGWVWKSDIGDFSDIESVKGSVSDSIKRAAVQWGVARDLYPKPSDKRGGGNSRRAASGSGDATVSSGNSSSRRSTRSAGAGTRRARSAASEPVEVGTDNNPDAVEVVAGGLTERQERALEARFRKAEITGDRRKAAIYLLTMKHSRKQLTQADLDHIFDFLDNPEPEMLENIMMAKAD